MASHASWLDMAAFAKGEARVREILVEIESHQSAIRTLQNEQSRVEDWLAASRRLLGEDFADEPTDPFAPKGTMSQKDATLRVLEEAGERGMHVRNVLPRARALGAVFDAKDPVNRVDSLLRRLYRQGEPGLVRMGGRKWCIDRTHASRVQAQAAIAKLTNGWRESAD
jgi:hypothetical protein